ncbi:unnamed protein product [Amoebophrya sp. A120]|nr:unnamed protein product [Amoebophrya sp. A120]|eukprot:GSA120T00022154001.1
MSDITTVRLLAPYPAKGDQHFIHAAGGSCTTGTTTATTPQPPAGDENRKFNKDHVEVLTSYSLTGAVVLDGTKSTSLTGLSSSANVVSLLRERLIAENAVPLLGNEEITVKNNGLEVDVKLLLPEEFFRDDSAKKLGGEKPCLSTSQDEDEAATTGNNTIEEHEPEIEKTLLHKWLAWLVQKAVDEDSADKVGKWTDLAEVELLFCYQYGCSFDKTNKIVDNLSLLQLLKLFPKWFQISETGQELRLLEKPAVAPTVLSTAAEPEPELVSPHDKPSSLKVDLDQTLGDNSSVPDLSSSVSSNKFRPPPGLEALSATSSLPKIINLENEKTILTGSNDDDTTNFVATTPRAAGLRPTSLSQGTSGFFGTPPPPPPLPEDGFSSDEEEEELSASKGTASNLNLSNKQTSLNAAAEPFTMPQAPHAQAGRAAMSMKETASQVAAGLSSLPDFHHQHHVHQYNNHFPGSSFACNIGTMPGSSLLHYPQTPGPPPLAGPLPQLPYYLNAGAGAANATTSGGDQQSAARKQELQMKPGVVVQQPTSTSTTSTTHVLVATDPSFTGMASTSAAAAGNYSPSHLQYHGHVHPAPQMQLFGGSIFTYNNCNQGSSVVSNPNVLVGNPPGTSACGNGTATTVQNFFQQNSSYVSKKYYPQSLLPEHLQHQRRAKQEARLTQEDFAMLADIDSDSDCSSDADTSDEENAALALCELRHRATVNCDSFLKLFQNHCDLNVLSYKKEGLIQHATKWKVEEKVTVYIPELPAEGTRSYICLPILYETVARGKLEKVIMQKTRCGIQSVKHDENGIYVEIELCKNQHEAWVSLQLHITFAPPESSAAYM